MSRVISYAYCLLKQTCIGDLYRKLRYDRILSNAGEAEKQFIKYCGAETENKQEIITDMLDAASKFRFGFDEYFYYHLYGKTDSERHEFISDREHLNIIRKINKARNEFIFDDKAETYRRFSSFYHRDVFYSTGGTLPESFTAFTQKHERFIVKPLSSACGWGIEIMDVSAGAEQVWSDLQRKYCRGIRGGFIAEELIQQAEEMKSIHPESVNTVRIPTLRMNNRVEIIHPCMRVGRGKSIVDNGGSGGIFCAVEISTGKITAAADEIGHQFSTHPETGLPLIGFQIPRWEEALDLAKKLAYIVPSNRYTGWDLALTNEKWIMVEGNARGQFVWQIPYQKGFRKEMEDYLKELGIKY